MSDIFISYRRGDGVWARLLARDLGEHFDIFFDGNRDSIDLGDDFPKRIADALKDCRVCLVVMGPEWVTDKNLKRLATAEDWVRREAETALGSKRVRTVPLLAGGAVFPEAAALPESLQPLLSANALTLDDAKWDAVCASLIERAQSWLLGDFARPATKGGMPPALPYLCDRVPQQDALIEVVTGPALAGSAYVCVVHGHKDELHESFLERVKHRAILENVFSGQGEPGELGLSWSRLQWNIERAKAGQFDLLLRRALKNDAMQRFAATDTALVEHLHQLPRPLVAVLQVTWHDVEVCGPGLVPGLIEAWRSLFAEVANLEGAGATPASLAMPALLWINLTYDSDQDEIAKIGASGLLPRLAPVSGAHVQEWLAFDEVKRVVAGHEAEVLDLIEGAGEIRMRRFVDEVRRILAAG